MTFDEKCELVKKCATELAAYRAKLNALIPKIAEFHEDMKRQRKYGPLRQLTQKECDEIFASAMRRSDEFMKEKKG